MLGCCPSLRSEYPSAGERIFKMYKKNNISKKSHAHPAPVDGHKAKKERILSLLSDNQTSEYFKLLAEGYVDAEDCEPQIMPSPVPGRAGVARFPLIVDILGSTYASVGGSLMIVAKPDVNDPLEITNVTVPTSDTDQYVGYAEIAQGGSVRGPSLLTADRTGDDAKIRPEWIGEYLAIRCVVTGGAAGQLTVTAAFSYLNVSTNLRVVGWDGTAWILVGQISVNPGVSEYSFTTAASSYLANMTHFTFTLAGNAGGVRPAARFNWGVVPSVACQQSDGSNMSVMTVHKPLKLTEFLDSVEFAEVQHMSCRVTYRGSTIDNAGMIAAANIVDNFALSGDAYGDISSRPFDVYDGRIEHGAHWHYVPSNAQTLADSKYHQPDRTIPPPCGFFGIAALNGDSGALRVRVDMVISFFSTEPQYTMEYQPPYAGVSELLHLLRTEVPLVSSNGSVAKLRRAAAKHAKQAANYAINNPDKMAEAFGLLLTLL